MKSSKKILLSIGIVFSSLIGFSQVPNYLPTNGLLAWYPFSGNANDASGNNNNGVNNGATLTSDRFGNANAAYSFNGSGSFIQLPNIQPPFITVSFWFKLNSNQSKQSLIRNRAYGYGVQYNWDFPNDYGGQGANKLCAFLSLDSAVATKKYEYVAQPNVNDGAWHHVAFSYDGMTYKLYLDTVNIFSSSTHGSDSVFYKNLGTGFTIGKDGDFNNYYFNGLVDDVSIFNRALSEQEVKNIFTQTAITQNQFITKWYFQGASGSMNFNALTSGPVNYTWVATPSGNSGSGSFNQLVQGGANLAGLNIAAGDTVTLYMEPQNLMRFYLNSGADASKLIDVVQWGAVAWSNMASAFSGCINLNITATDTPNLANVTSLSNMFVFCSKLNGPANINDWNTTNITNMNSVFARAKLFNQPIGNWNTSNVTNMAHMFTGAEAFNQPIGNWNTGNVTNMATMFNDAFAFNQDISNWNTENVTDMNAMFLNAKAFNQPIGNWNTSKVTNMSNMFSDAISFNQPIGNWNTSSVTDMSLMFLRNSAFNQPIGNWNTSNVTTMNNMFSLATSFNHPVGNWNTANVTGMSFMFNKAQSFNQQLGNWQLNSNVGMFGMLDSSGIDCNNYSATLIGWANGNPSPSGANLGAKGIQYGINAITARDTLVARGWTITGDQLSNTNCGMVGVDDAYYINQVTVFQDRLVVSPQHPLQIMVIGMNGQVITDSQYVTNTTVSFSNWSPGIYLMVINQKAIKKFAVY